MSETTAASTTARRTKSRAARGNGRVFLRGNIWWVSYCWRGKEQRESSKSTRPVDAERLLGPRLREIGRGRTVSPTAEARVTVGELLDALLVHYKNEGRRSTATLTYHLPALREGFGDLRAVDVTGAHVERYKADRRAAKMAPASVNRELAALRRAFRLGVEDGRILQTPTIRLFREDNARQGFVAPADFERVVAALPTYLQDFARFAFLTGWRRGELRTLAWADVDRAAGLVTLRAEHSKNGEPRALPLVGDLADLIARRWAARELRGKDSATHLCPLVFHRAGHMVGDFRKAWRAACRTAGVPGLLLHDLRRSAVREMDRAGVKPVVAMVITGHKTPSMWRRYRITDAAEVREALALTQAAAKAQSARSVVPLRAASDG
jgi:integrase